MKNSDQQAKEKSLADAAYDIIQDKIVTGDLKSHELLSESALARELQCGRTPVREALQRLQFEGFVQILPRRGILVTSVEISQQLNLLETRRPLEQLAVKLAARRATEGQRAKMNDLADELESAISNGNRTQYLAINKSIHRIVAESTANRFLKSQIDVVHNLSRRFWYSFINDTQAFASAAELHAETLRAIAKGDQELAATQNKALLELLETVTRSTIENLGEAT